MDREIINRYLKELLSRLNPANLKRPDRSGRIRRPGAGRKRTAAKDPTLRSDLISLLEPYRRADPASGLSWTSKSIRTLVDELKGKGHGTSRRMVAELLHEMGYDLHSKEKIIEQLPQTDREAQFEYIYHVINAFQDRSHPVISVMSRKIRMNLRDMKSRNPVGENIDSEKGIALFTMECIRRWWTSAGCTAYPDARELLIIADACCQSGFGVSAWKSELHKLVDETGVEISVSLLPPGTRRICNIEHYFLSDTHMIFSGEPAVSYEVAVALFRKKPSHSVSTKSGDTGITGIANLVRDNDVERRCPDILSTAPDPAWNFTVKPHLSPLANP